MRETERTKNKVLAGYYSKSDMKTELKWNQNLREKYSMTDCCQLRKKIDGAIKLCQQDPDNLVRLRQIRETQLKRFYGSKFLSLISWGQDLQVQRGRGVLGRHSRDWPTRK